MEIYLIRVCVCKIVFKVVLDLWSHKGQRSLLYYMYMYWIYFWLHGLTITLSLANRTEPNLADVFEAFRDLGINLSDLAEFTREVESVPPPEPIPRYPIPRSSTHIYHAPSGGKPAAANRRARMGSLSSEDELDRDHIPPYLPPLPLEADEEKGILCMGV